jgi:hypothetical protein
VLVKGAIELLLDGGPQVLQKMKTVRDLFSLRRSLFGSLSVQPASVPAHNPDTRMTFEPICNRLSRAIGKDVDYLPPLQIHHDCAVATAPLPAPIVDADHTQGHLLPTDRLTLIHALVEGGGNSTIGTLIRPEAEPFNYQCCPVSSGRHRSDSNGCFQ